MIVGIATSIGICIGFLLKKLMKKSCKCYEIYNIKNIKGEKCGI